MTEQEVRVIAAKWYETMPPGWEMQVWKGMGWHFRFTRGIVSINYDKYHKKFWAIIADDHGSNRCGAGIIRWRGNRRYVTPQGAVAGVRQKMLDYMERRTKEFEEIKETVAKAIIGL
jgi:hypothetical protein